MVDNICKNWLIVDFSCLALSRLWGSLWTVSRVESSAWAHLAFRDLSCWEASVTLYLWFPFWAQSMIAICRRLCSHGGIINSSCGNYGFFYPGVNPLKTVGVYGLCPKLRAWRTCASPSNVYPTGKLQWHFTCGFDFTNQITLKPNLAQKLKLIIKFSTIKGQINVLLWTQMGHKGWGKNGKTFIRCYATALKFWDEVNANFVLLYFSTCSSIKIWHLKNMGKNNNAVHLRLFLIYLL